MKKGFTVFLVIALLPAPCLHAKGIWPFNTPRMEAHLICKNAADTAEHVAKSRSLMSLSEWLEEYQNPDFNRPENYLLKREYIRAIKTVYRNKNITPKTLKKMVKEDCNARKSKLIEEIKRRRKN